MGHMFQPLIAEAVTSAVQAHGLGRGEPVVEVEGDRPAPEADQDRAIDDNRPVGLLGVGEFKNALQEARAADQSR
jgi:hypothetical protein